MSAQSMRIAIATPGPFGGWAFEVVGRLAAACGLAVRYLDRTDTIDASPGEPIVHLASYPGRSVIAAIQSGSPATVQLLGDPMRDVSSGIAGGQTLLEAIRAATASATANLAIGRSGRATVIAEDGRRSAVELARDIALGLALPADAARLAAALGPDDGLSSSTPLAAVLERRVAAPFVRDNEATVRRLVGDAVLPLHSMSIGRFDQPIRWPGELFFSGDRPNQPAPAVMALAGPARVIAYGPYLHLPPAEYAVEVMLEFTGRIEDIPFQLEIHGSRCLARARIDGRPSGSYRGSFGLRVDDPVDAVEARLRVDRGAIEGQVAFGGLSLLPRQ
jgi:hypothetical protein